MTSYTISRLEMPRIHLNTNKNACLLELENVIVELQLQHFVAEIDAKLLERVGLKHLKAENIKQRNALLDAHNGVGDHRARIRLDLAVAGRVQAAHQPVELAAV